MSAHDGGQAFPRAGYDGPDGVGTQDDGMSLRDYFAAKAMQAIVSRDGIFSYQYSYETTAEWAYAYADAMLKAREAQQ